jgi:hypothetical protein
MKIIRILKVVDTRQYEEIGDKWEPIPGSGDEHECSRCGRLHEIHALVELEDGDNAIVGTGCMKADEAEIQKRVKSMTSTAKTLRRNQAELAAIRAKQAIWDKAEAEVMAMPAEVQIVVSEKISERGRKYITIEYHVNGWNATWTYADRREYVADKSKSEDAVIFWRAHMMQKITGMYARPSSGHIESAIAKAVQRMAAVA